MYYYHYVLLFFCCFLFSIFLWFLWVYKNIQTFSAPKPKFGSRSIFHGEDEDEGSSQRMSIESKHVSIHNEFRGKLIVSHKTEIGEGKRIGEIPEEEAICGICSILFKDDVSALMTACGCDSFLVHENCKLKTPKSRTSEKCYSCDQVFKDMTVTLSRSRSINVENKSSTKRSGSRFSNMLKWSKRA